MLAHCWQRYWAGAGNTVLAQYRNAIRGDTGPVQYAVTGPVLAPYWASTGPMLACQYWPHTVCRNQPSTGPILGQYWANTGSELYTKNLANINYSMYYELYNWEKIHHIVTQCTSCAHSSVYNKWSLKHLSSTSFNNQEWRRPILSTYATTCRYKRYLSNANIRCL